MENKEVKNNGRNPVWFILLIILLIVKIWIKNERIESDKASQEMVQIVQNFTQNQDSYMNLKMRILDLSYKDISSKYKDNKVIAVLYDMGLDSSSIATMAITIDNTASILVPDIKNSIYKATDKGVLNISDSILLRAEKLLPHMESFDNRIRQPKQNEIMVYVRTGDLKTLVHRIDVKNKNKTYEEKGMLEGFTSLWKEMTKE